jgi:murein L,D-transpeptidase YcbB/YkuD
VVDGAAEHREDDERLWRLRSAPGQRLPIVRQAPGPRNALGRIKIEMPNEHAIYLHDTPSQSLFNQERRAYSHGCIRTHNIRGFAETLLRPTGQWNRGQIDTAIDAGKTVQARLAAPIPVYIAYFTGGGDGGRQPGHLRRRLRPRRPRPARR